MRGSAWPRWGSPGCSGRPTSPRRSSAHPGRSRSTRTLRPPESACQRTSSTRSTKCSTAWWNAARSLPTSPRRASSTAEPVAEHLDGRRVPEQDTLGLDQRPQPFLVALERLAALVGLDRSLVLPALIQPELVGIVH